MSDTTTGLRAHIVARRGTFELDVVLDVEPGETVALLGPNGAGKSTTIASITGAIPIDAGSIRLGGRVVDDPVGDVFVPPEHRRIGVVFQDHALFPHLDATDNVAFGLRARGHRSAAARRTALDWLDKMGVRDVANLRPDQLSGGQAQRVALARALAMDPELILLDEPLAALDVSSRAGTRRALIEHLRDFAGPRVVVTHDTTDAFLLAERIVVIEEGAVTQSGPAAELRRRPASPYVADLVGLNLVTGSAQGGVIEVDGGGSVTIADTALAGRVIATIHPRVVSLHPDQPHGSHRNVWSCRVAAIEELGDRVRVQLDRPAAITAEITPAAAHELGLRPGSSVWAAVKATEIVAHLDDGG